MTCSGAACAFLAAVITAARRFMDKKSAELFVGEYSVEMGSTRFERSAGMVAPTHSGVADNDIGSAHPARAPGGVDDARSH